LPVYERALEQRPRSTRGWVNLGIAYVALRCCSFYVALRCCSSYCCWEA
jgi:hypothetical protein